MKFNFPELEYLLVFFVEGMYEDIAPDLSNYNKYISEYRGVIDQYSPEQKTKSLQSLKAEIRTLLEETELSGINQWFCEHALHYLESDEKVVELMKRVRSFFEDDDAGEEGSDLHN